MQRLYITFLLAGLLSACSTTPDPNKNFKAYADQLKDGSLVDSFHISEHAFLVHFEKHTIPDPPPPVKTEAELLRQDSVAVSRHGDSLLLKLANNSIYTVVSDTAKYMGYFPSIQHYLVNMNPSYLLVGAENGDTVQLGNEPLISPDHQYLLCTSFNSDFPGYQLYTYQGGKISRIGFHASSLWSTGPLNWTDNNTLYGAYFKKADSTIYTIPVKVTMN